MAVAFARRRLAGAQMLLPSSGKTCSPTQPFWDDTVQASEPEDEVAIALLVRFGVMADPKEVAEQASVEAAGGGYGPASPAGVAAGRHVEDSVGSVW